MLYKYGEYRVTVISTTTTLQFMYVTRRKRMPSSAYTSSLSFAPPGSTMHLRRHEGLRLPSHNHRSLPPLGPGGGGSGQLVCRSDMAVNGGVGTPVWNAEYPFLLTRMYRVTQNVSNLGWVDLELKSSLGWWAGTMVTYCPSRMVEHLKSEST